MHLCLTLVNSIVPFNKLSLLSTGWGGKELFQIEVGILLADLLFKSLIDFGCFHARLLGRLINEPLLARCFLLFLFCHFSFSRLILVVVVPSIIVAPTVVIVVIAAFYGSITISILPLASLTTIAIILPLWPVIILILLPVLIGRLLVNLINLSVLSLRL